MRARIEQIRCIPLRYLIQGRFKFFEDAQGRPTGRPAVLVCIRADNGIEGYGQSVPIPRRSYETLETVVTTIERYLAPALVGREVEDLEAIHAVMNQTIAPAFSIGQPICKAGIDLALHDLIGKLHGQSVSALWGRTPLRPILFSYTLNPRTLDEVPRLIEEGKAKGYQNFNVKVGPDPSFDFEFCKLVRKLAPDTFLWADANGGYTEEQAEIAVRKLADAGVDVLEQPLPPNHLSGYRRLRQIGALPILMDEGIVSHVELKEFINLGLLDGVAMKPARCGGLWEAKKQIELLQERGLMVLGSGLTDPDLSLAASLHLYSAFGIDKPAALNGPQFLSASILQTPLQPVEGQLPPPDGPGLGVQIDWEKVESLRLNLWP